MGETEMELNPMENELDALKCLDKCAIIYRKDPLSFVYVCYHCGVSFREIDCTLQHIESHFQLVQVTVDESYLKSECSTYPTNTNLDSDNDPVLEVKTEVMGVEEDVDGHSSQKSTTFDCRHCDSIFASKFSFRSHTFREHNQKETLDCAKCGKQFKRDVSFEKHLIQHIDKGEVDWNCAGDGISEPAGQCSENSSPSAQTEVQKEQSKAKKKTKTLRVRSNQGTRQLSTYICHKCSETCSTLNDLNDHLKAHSSEDLLQINKCKECRKYFRSALDLRLHVLEIHLSVNKFKCSACSVVWSKEDKSLVQMHLEAHLADDSAKWTDLVQGIDNKEKIVTKYEDITLSIESSCELCDGTFYLKSNFDEHVRCMHWDNENELRCPQCDAVFTRLQCYFAHQLEHRRVGGTVIETDINALVSNLNTYIEEQFVCNEEENSPNPYKCSICQIDRDSLFEIRRHVRERHVYRTLPQPVRPNLQDKFTCNTCGMLIKRNSFRTHLMTHTDIKKHKCSTCGNNISM